MTSEGVKVCAIAGGSGAGKTTLAKMLLDRLGASATHLTIDWYYRDLSHLIPAERAAVNFDHPDSLEVELFARHLELLRSGQKIEAPVYDFAAHMRTAEVLHIEADRYIVTEGIHLLGLDVVRPLYSLGVFIDVAPDIRLERRIGRDVAERGRTETSVREQWLATVAPMHDKFVQPSRRFADRVVTVDEDFNDVADELAERLR